MILTRCQWDNGFAITNHNETGFFTNQEFLNHHPRAIRVVGDTEAVIQQHVVHGRQGLSHRHGDHHALASRQTVRFDNDRRPHLGNVSAGQRDIGKGFERRRGNPVSCHEGF